SLAVCSPSSVGWLKEQRTWAGAVRIIGRDADGHVGFAPPDMKIDVAPAGARSEIFGGLDANAPFLVVYTAGSTGRPKGIQIAAGTLIAHERMFCDELGITEHHRFYNFLPMSYLGGVHNLLLLPLSVGGSVVIDQPFGPSNIFAFWRRVRE